MNYPSIIHASFTGFIGFAEEDITPPVGIYARNWGAAQHDVAEGIHKPLKLTCLSFQTDHKSDPLILISADLGWWKSLADESLVRSAILNALSLDESRLMICLSHTHAGPVICRDDASKPGGEFIEPYLMHISKIAITAAKQALSNAKKATLSWKYGKCDLATNRDLPEKNTQRYVVGLNAIEKADDTLLVGRVTDESGKIIATIINYACHPTTLAWDNRLISPDYIGAMRELIESHTGAGCIFLQGASGELAPAEQYSGDTKIADAYGRQLGYATLAILESMLTAKTKLSFERVVESGAPLAIWKRISHQPSSFISAQIEQIPFKLKPLPSLVEIEEGLHDCEDRVLKERLRRKRNVRISVGDGEVSSMPLWIWRLGDSILFGQPNEAYSEFQQELRAQVGSRAVVVMNLVNGYVGYLPPHRLYDKDIYSVWQTPFESGSLELLTQTAVEAAMNILKQ